MGTMSAELQQDASVKGRKIDWGDLLPRIFTCAAGGLIGWIVVLLGAFFILAGVLGWWGIKGTAGMDPDRLFMHRLAGHLLVTVPITGAIFSALATWRWWGNAR